jgi:hypothetical protein
MASTVTLASGAAVEFFDDVVALLNGFFVLFSQAFGIGFHVADIVFHFRFAAVELVFIIEVAIAIHTGWFAWFAAKQKGMAG